MRVFIDTNILIDFVVNREGFSEDADKLFALGITGDIKLMHQLCLMLQPCI